MEQLTPHQNTDTAHPQDVVPIYFFHTLEHPFCPLPRCWCHANQQESGRDARDITVFTANDIATAVAALQTNLDQETHDQAQAEMKPGQQELPLVCTTSTTANHRPGDQAQQVHVTVTKHCLALAYTLSGVWQQVTRAIAKSIPSSYRLVRVTILLLTATVTAGTLSHHSRHLFRA